MIDEKKKIKTGNIEISDNEFDDPLDCRDQDELIRLAKLGRWADKHGVSALELTYNEHLSYLLSLDNGAPVIFPEHHILELLNNRAQKALSALPKEE